MFCSGCGEKNEEEAKFCRSCGQPLKIAKNKNSKKRNALIIFSSLVIAGASGFSLQQYLSSETEQTINETTIENSTSATEQPKKKEKTAVIKETQQKVYTILTDDGLGSGFLFSNDGMVVTNAHVVAGMIDVIVRDIDGEEHPGKVIGISDMEDIALIQVDAFRGINPLPAEMNVTEVGTEVIALGSPNGFENSASIGYLTGIDRDITFDFQYENVYQIDAQIAPGSSGGPLIDAESGKVIGINSLLYTEGNAIGFSIPLHSVHSSLSEWKNRPMSPTEVAAVFGVYTDYEESGYDEEQDEWELVEYELSQFVTDYRDFYEMALAEEDFYYVEDMLLYDSPIYYGISAYIDQIYGRGMIFEFTDFTVLDVEIFEGYALVYTYEAFDFMNASGEWSYEEREKTYTVVVDDYGTYFIRDIVNN